MMGQTHQKTCVQDLVNVVLKIECETESNVTQISKKFQISLKDSRIFCKWKCSMWGSLWLSLGSTAGTFFIIWLLLSPNQYEWLGRTNWRMNLSIDLHCKDSPTTAPSTKRGLGLFHIYFSVSEEDRFLISLSSKIIQQNWESYL